MYRFLTAVILDDFPFSCIENSKERLFVLMVPGVFYLGIEILSRSVFGVDIRVDILGNSDHLI